MSEAASPEQQVRCHIYASGWTRLAIRALIRLAPRLREVPPHQRASLSLMVVSDDVSWESVKAVRDNPLSRQLVLCSRRVDDDLRRQAAEHGVTVMSLSIVTQGMETFLLGAAAPTPTATVIPIASGSDVDDHTQRFRELSPMESRVIALIAEGATNEEIATQLFLSPNTVKSYIRSAYRKMGVSRRSQAVAWALRA